MTRVIARLSRPVCEICGEPLDDSEPYLRHITDGRGAHD